MAKVPKRRRSDRVPKHRQHATGQGCVDLGGRTFYTGKWGTAQSEAKYRQLVGEWIASDRKTLPTKKASPAADDLGITVAELCLAFTNQARAAYRDDDGNMRSEFYVLEIVAKMVTARFGLL